MKWLVVIVFLIFPSLSSAQSESVVIDALVSGCGNTVVEAGEACDASNLAGQSCSTLGFSSGILSCSSSCTFVTAGCVVAPPSTGSGGTRVSTVSANAVVLAGTAVPQSVVWLLRDGVRIASVVSQTSGHFDFSLPSFPIGTHRMSLYAEAADGLRTSAFSFPLSITWRGTTKFETFSLSPTLDVSQLGVTKGQALDIYGSATPDSDVVIVVYKMGQAVFQTTGRTSINGRYTMLVPTDSLSVGQYTILAYAVKDGRVSAPSRVLSVTIGDITIDRYRNFDTCAFIRGDVNRDCRVDIRDVFLVREWQAGRGYMGLTELERLSGDGYIDIRDYSIIFYAWTG